MFVRHNPDMPNSLRSSSGAAAEAMAFAQRGACAIASTPVASPCINICQIDERSGLCRGCRRTLDEIQAWSLYDDEERRALWQQLLQRGQP